MDAINNPFRSALAGCVLGVFAGAGLLSSGLLNPLTALLAIGVLAAAVWLFVPTTAEPQRNLSSAHPGRRYATSGVGNDADLDRWVGDAAAQGRLLEPTASLAATAARELGRPVGRGTLCAALERFHARRAVIGARSGRAA